MKIKALFSSAFAAFLIAAGAYNSHAQSIVPANDVPRTISYQGVLADNSGRTLPDGNYRITLSLYADPAGSLKVWQDTYDANVSGGVFNLYLGAGNNRLPDLAAMNTALWIGTQVGDAPQMYPLTPLSASPYALNIPDRAVTTAKLADGAVTADKVDMPYIAGVQINDRKIAGTGTVLKLKGSDAITLDYDEATNSVTIGAGNAAERGTAGDKEKGAVVLDNVDANDNWKGRTTASNPLIFGTPLGNYNTLAGGFSNSIGASVNHSTIPGGKENIIDALVYAGVIGGGEDNIISSITQPMESIQWPTIAGGHQNEVHAGHGFIGGGHINIVSSESGTIAGGWENVVYGDYGFVGGGKYNGSYDMYSSVGGGEANSAGDPHSTVAGGLLNNNRGEFGFIGGGESNEIWNQYGVIAGGKDNMVNNGYGFIGGGEANSIAYLYSDYSAIGGGSHNTISGWASVIGGGDQNQGTSNYTTISGGIANRTTADLTTVGGGSSNQAKGLQATIGGGFSNIASGTVTTIGGGESNSAQGQYSTIPGGKNLMTTGYAQTAVGYLNASRGTLTSPPTTTAAADNPLFMIGNGDGTVLPPAHSNAFEVSYNGHSVVYDVNGYIRTPIRGATYVDNILYAWGSVNANGGINVGSEFGVVSVAHVPGSGVYDVRIAVNDPQTGAPVILTKSSVTANIRDEGSEAFCGIITLSELGTPGANQFRVRIRDLQCQPHDAPFMFKVTGRP